MPEIVRYNGEILAIFIRHEPSLEGINFITPSSFSQQVAQMRHPAGKTIAPHIHNHVVREVVITQEVLIIKSGKLRVDLYDDQRNYVESRIIGAGDAVLLASGGHGFKILEDIDMIEVKQGPHVGETDKTRFTPVGDQIIIVK